MLRSRERDEHIARLNGGALCGHDGSDDTGFRRQNLVFHIHRVEDTQYRALFYLMAGEHVYA